MRKFEQDKCFPTYILPFKLIVSGGHHEYRLEIDFYFKQNENDY